MSSTSNTFVLWLAIVSIQVLTYPNQQIRQTAEAGGLVAFGRLTLSKNRDFYIQMLTLVPR
jgi:hypothetical protein